MKSMHANTIHSRHKHMYRNVWKYLGSKQGFFASLKERNVIM